MAKLVMRLNKKTGKMETEVVGGVPGTCHKIAEQLLPGIELENVANKREDQILAEREGMKEEEQQQDYA